MNREETNAAFNTEKMCLSRSEELHIQTPDEMVKEFSLCSGFSAPLFFLIHLNAQISHNKGCPSVLSSRPSISCSKDCLTCLEPVRYVLLLCRPLTDKCRRTKWSLLHFILLPLRALQTHRYHLQPFSREMNVCTIEAPCSRQTTASEQLQVNSRRLAWRYLQISAGFL